MQKVRKAVIPAAGYGTRMLPITKTVSKEILPLVDKPIIQYVVEELIEAGIEDIIIITAAHKADLVDYFGEVEAGLRNHLQMSGPKKAALLEQLENVSKMANFAFIEQHGIYGTGTPVLNAEPYLGGEPFIYTFADDFFVSRGDNSFKQLIDTYEKYDAPVMACIRRGGDLDYGRYGYVGGSELESGVMDVKTIVEQPGKENAPSDMATLAGFLVTPDVLPFLHSVRDNLPEGRELFFNSSLGLMAQDGQRVIAKEIIDADYFDTGNRVNFMKTSVEMAARHPEIGEEFREFLRDFVNRG